jgi:hypothetical protein
MGLQIRQFRLIEEGWGLVRGRVFRAVMNQPKNTPKETGKYHLSK